MGEWRESCGSEEGAAVTLDCGVAALALVTVDIEQNHRRALERMLRVVADRYNLTVG